MCGINGIHFRGKTPPRSPEDLMRSMNQSIVHRGPDNSGVWLSDDAQTVFGHQRLSIIDLSTQGHQPMVLKSGIAISFNGEIYNYQDLKKLVPDFNFQSNSDTEVILALYEKYGIDFIQKLNGMFAFALYNPSDENLLLVRDRIGKKPLYYTELGGYFAWSSEIRSLLELPWIKPELDEESLYHYLTYNFVPPPSTMFNKIYKLEPGQYLKMSKNGKIRVDSYWEVEWQNLRELSELEVADTLAEKLEKAVELRMVSDVPVGAFLSGGVDSSTIVALMNRHTNRPVKTYSIGFAGQSEYDELAEARSVAKLLNTDHYEKVINASDIRDFLPKIVDVLDEPLADTTAIPIYFLSQMAKENNSKVILTGDGPDELLLGYSNWKKYVQFYPYYRLLSQMPKAIKNLIKLGGNFFEDGGAEQEIFERLGDGSELFWGGARSFKEGSKRQYLSENFIHRNKEVWSGKIIERYKSQYTSSLKANRKYSDSDWMSYLGFKFLIPNFYMHRADRLSMAHSVEARAPFLDFNFVNTAISVPKNLKIKNGEPKFALKKACERYLPKEVLYRKKKGFCVPIREWGSDIMIDYLQAELPSFGKKTDIFNVSEIGHLITEVKKGNSNFINRLWTIYFFVNWYNRWIEK